MSVLGDCGGVFGSNVREGASICVLAQKISFPNGSP
jgi:hypothetical protein